MTPQIGVIEAIGVADALIRHDLQIFAAERMAAACREVGERHPECAANLRLHMVNLAGETVGRQPFGHRIRLEEGAKHLLRPGSEDAMQTNGIALGHDVIFSVTERSLSHDLAGSAQSLPQGRPALTRADNETKKYPGDMAGFRCNRERSKC